MTITKKKKKWQRFPPSYDKFLDATLRIFCAILKKTNVVYVVDLKYPEPERTRSGRVIWKRKRVYGSYEPETDTIKIRIVRSPKAGIYFHNYVKLIVKTALHEAMEKVRSNTELSIRHKFIELWEYSLFERMNEKQIAYVWSLLPSLPKDQ